MNPDEQQELDRLCHAVIEEKDPAKLSLAVAKLNQFLEALETAIHRSETKNNASRRGWCSNKGSVLRVRCWKCGDLAGKVRREAGKINAGLAAYTRKRAAGRTTDS
jgi:hypothetical protein